jgi:hypothetical protein
MCLVDAVTLIIVFSNSCYTIAARLPYGDVNRHRNLAAAASQRNGEQWQSDVLLSRDHMLLANERQMNKSRDRLLANERRQWITSKSLADSKSIRRRSKRKILRFDIVPERKWRLPIKYKIDLNISGKTAARKMFCICGC